MNNLGNVKEKMGEFKEAHDFYMKSISIKKEISDLEGISVSYNNIGHLYKTSKEYSKALKYFGCH